MAKRLMPKMINVEPYWSKGKAGTLIIVAVTVFYGCNPLLVMADVYFNPAALEIQGDGQAVDLAGVLSQGKQLPGTYLVDIYLNDSFIESRRINFRLFNERLIPELDLVQLKKMGVKVDAFLELKNMPLDAPLMNLGQYIPAASSEFDFSQQRLNISIPQAALNNQIRGQITPSEWDQGVTSGFINYSFRGGNTDNKGGDSAHSQFISLRSGANWGAWRFRNYSTYINATETDSQWNTINTYAERDIHAIRGRLTLGESFTSSTLFDSLPFLGGQLTSDESMLPESQRGFAPVVRGIARSNAQVTIHQNGYIIYQTYVAPGKFEITDLFPTSSSGDLELTITEADGTKQHSVLPYSAVPIMVREKSWRYALAAGQYHSTTVNALKTNFSQGSLVYGLLNDTTIYSGFQLADNYQALVFGVGRGLGEWGSVSLDATGARAMTGDDGNKKGQSYRAQYAKEVKASGTSMTLAGYRYTSSDFYDFSEVNEPADWSIYYKKQRRWQLQVNQSLGRWGNMYISSYQQKYWHRDGFDHSVSAGYNLNAAGVNYGLSYAYNQQPYGGHSERQLAVNVQIPLNIGGRNNWTTFNLNNNSHGDSSQQFGIGGTTLENDSLSYNVQQSYANRYNGASGNLSANYKSRYANLNGGYSYNDQLAQLHYGIDGAIVGHPYGITYAQPLGDTMALVKARGAGDVRVQNGTNILTDARGYAVVPYVTPYAKNRIALDTQTMAENLDMDTNVRTVIPTKGALVLADYKTFLGSRVLMTFTYQGSPVPFGAQAILLMADGEEGSRSIVGNDGQAYFSGVPQNGQVHVSWGDKANYQCSAPYGLPELDVEVAVRMVEVQCL
ncbi:fimbria/pilus outer membrane usher protein [Shewanella chilikensis]|uniref:fimbria/pilus outer membrane usher protein n=1 Tax=Shewanella chilikensis TaxID=558541 RepID=UPI0030063803